MQLIAGEDNEAAGRHHQPKVGRELERLEGMRLRARILADMLGGIAPSFGIPAIVVEAFRIIL